MHSTKICKQILVIAVLSYTCTPESHPVKLVALCRTYLDII